MSIGHCSYSSFFIYFVFFTRSTLLLWFHLQCLHRLQLKLCPCSRMNFHIHDLHYIISNVENLNVVSPNFGVFAIFAVALCPYIDSPLRRCKFLAVVFTNRSLSAVHAQRFSYQFPKNRNSILAALYGWQTVLCGDYELDVAMKIKIRCTYFSIWTTYCTIENINTNFRCCTLL